MMREVVILGAKDSLGATFAYSMEGKASFTPLKLGEEVPSTFQVFPYANFSSLDEPVLAEEGLTLAYLRVQVDLSEEEFYLLDSSGLIFYQLRKEGVTLIGEESEPLSYALKYKSEVDPTSKLSTYGLTTWAIHYPIEYTEGEVEAALSFISLALLGASRRYPVDISIDEKILPILPLLLTRMKAEVEEGLLTFGRYGTIRLLEVDLGGFSPENLVTLVKGGVDPLPLLRKGDCPSPFELSDSDKLVLINSLYDSTPLVELGVDAEDLIRIKLGAVEEGAFETLSELLEGDYLYTLERDEDLYLLPREIDARGEQLESMLGSTVTLARGEMEVFSFIPEEVRAEVVELAKEYH